MIYTCGTSSYSPIYSYPVWNSLLGIGYTMAPIGMHEYSMCE